MKRALWLTMGMAVALVVAAAGQAATMSGKVVSTDIMSRSVTIQTDDGKRFTFTSNDATRIERNGAAIRLGDLQKDSEVTVTSEQAPSDPTMQMLATSVNVEKVAEAQPTAAAEDYRSAKGTRVAAARLPRTATGLPLMELFGTGSLLCGLGIMLRRRLR